jgi:hypothetical protein
MRWLIRGAACGCLIYLLVLSGCEQEAVRLARLSAAKDSLVASPAEDHSLATVTFCRKIGSKTGKRIGVGEHFTIGGKARVTACVDFRNVSPGKNYAVHLVWIKPFGREVFRKYAEVEVAETETGYRSVIHWRKADDLNYLREEIQESSEAAFTLTSRMTISPQKKRSPGIYTLRVYLHRELLTEKSFQLSDS